MPDTIFFALKLIGYFLLAALCVASLLLCAALFAPIKYDGGLSVRDTVDSLNLNLRFSWLFRIVRGTISYNGGELKWQADIAWKRLGQSGGAKKEAHFAKGLKKGGGKKGNFKDKAKKAYGIIKSLKGKSGAVKRFFADGAHKAAFSKIFKETKIFLARIKPEKLTGSVCYGFDDPAATGELFALISILYPFIGGGLEAVPDFTEKRIEGEAQVRGKLRVSYAAALSVKLIADKNIRGTFADINKAINKAKKRKSAGKEEHTHGGRK